MILDRVHYVPMGWWRWAKVRMALFIYRLTGGFKKRIGLHQHFQTVSTLQESLGLKPKLRPVFRPEEMERARLSCPVDAISGHDKQWKIDPLRCHSCHLCIKLAPHSLELESNPQDEIHHFSP